jgi:hypothetical protein
MANPQQQKSVPKALEKEALRVITERTQVKDLVMVHFVEDTVPSTRKKIFKFEVVKKDDLNGPHHMVVLDEDKKPVELESLSVREGVKFFAVPEFVVDVKAIKELMAPEKPITIDPKVNDLVLHKDDTSDEVITVTVPKNPIRKADIYFLADTTGSMTSVINMVRNGANAILNALDGSGYDLAYGVGNYKDFPKDSYAFNHQLNPTTVKINAANEINNWSAGGGWDGSEAQLFALDLLAEPAGGTIGWRPDSRRIIVWIGDSPGHDPICKEISPESYDITESSVTKKLVNENITVIAISTITGFPHGLDDDPTKSAGDYTAKCTINGTSGQASRITSATGGVHKTGIDATEIVTVIIDLVKAAVSTINNLKLVPGGGTAPFVTSISPTSYGPLPGDKEYVLKFKVRFTGVVPCSFEDQVFTGTIDVIADGVVVATKKVKITVPRCSKIYSYSVKFVCGVQENNEGKCKVVRPGKYATDINIHNYHENEVEIRKFVLPLVLKGEPIGREPRFVGYMGKDHIKLPPNTATMDDCCRIAELLYGSTLLPLPLTIGFLEIISLKELSVDVVYTATDICSRTISIDHERVEGKLKYEPTASED